MRRNFDELQSFLHVQFPALAAADAVKGELYPPPWWAQQLASLGTLAQVGGLAVTLGGSFIFDTLGVPQPFFVPYMRENRVRTLFGIFVVNSVANSFLATGAFEVSIDGELVFSRLQQQRFPTGAEVMEALQQRGLKRRQF